MVKVGVVKYLKMALKKLPEGTMNEVLQHAIEEMNKSELLIENERNAAIDEMKERLSKYKIKN